MRLILKTKDRLVSVYWVSFNGKLITGWFSGEWLRKELELPDDFHFDSHFTYPASGNYHFSYKAMNVNREEFISVYWDMIKIKVIENGKRTLTQKSRAEVEGHNLSHLVGGYKHSPLDTVVNFQFPLVAFNVYEGDFKRREKMDRIVEQKDLRTDDLIVDVSNLKSHNLNMCAVICPLEQTGFAIENSIQFSKRYELPNSRALDLVCNILPIE